MRYSSLKKTQTNDTSPTQFPYNAPARSNKIYKSDEVFLIDDTKKSDTAKRRFLIIQKEISRPKVISSAYRKYAKAAQNVPPYLPR